MDKVDKTIAEKIIEILYKSGLNDQSKIKEIKNNRK